MRMQISIPLQFEYYRLIVEKIEKIGKEFTETKAKRLKE